MTSQDFNLQEFRHGVIVDTPIDHLWQYTITSTGITAWFIGTCLYTAPDGTERPQDKTAQTGDKLFWKSAIQKPSV